MSRDASELNHAVVVGLGFRSAPVPALDRARLSATFGAQRAAELHGAINALLVEMRQLPVDWAAHTLPSGSAWAREQMRARHPELSEDALLALEWKFSYDSR